MARADWRTSTAFLASSLIAAVAAAGSLSSPAPVEARQEPARSAPQALLYPKTVVLVRHAEKGADDPRDPSLAPAGLQRARDLARMLEPSGVTHLFASELQRTRQTLAPLALATGESVTVVSAGDRAALLSALRGLPRRSVAVVAGHSNTVPELVAALTGRDPVSIEIAETEHGRMFVVTLWSEEGASVLELAYGG